MTVLFIDTEVKAPFPGALNKLGLDNYAGHPDTRLLLVSYAIDDGPERVWDRHHTKMPSDLPAALGDNRVQVVAHNAQFDRVVLKHITALDIPQERWYCTRACAYAHGLPGGLDELSAIFKLGDDAKQDGSKLIDLFCEKGADPDEYPAEWLQFIDYSRHDIKALRALYKVMPAWCFDEREQRVYALDQKINDRGFAVDLDLARKMIEASTKCRASLDERVTALSGGAIQKATQRAKVQAFVGGLPDMKAETLRKALRDEPLSDASREMVSLRLLTSKSSVAKCQTAIDTASPDSRVRYTIQYGGGGRILRFSHKGFQPGNLPRPERKADVIASAIEALQLGWLDMIWGDEAQAVCSDALRGLIVAAPGHKLLIADWSNIEGRKLAWYAGAEWKLQLYRDKDSGQGEDQYKVIYGRMFGRDPSTVDDKDRQKGKGCLTGATMVLCESGYKRLDSVTAHDRVWDGEQWVEHQGLVNQGSQGVLKLCGLYLTPDHPVWSGTTFLRADSLVASSENTRCLALAAAAENLSLRVTWSALREASRGSLFNAIAALSSTLLKLTTSSVAHRLVATLAPSEQGRLHAKPGSALQMLWRTTRTADGCLIGSGRRGLAATAQMIPSTEIMAGAESNSAMRGEGAKASGTSWLTFKSCLAGIIQAYKWIERTLIRAMSLATYALLHGEKIWRQGDQCKVSNRSVLVYDLLSAGPRKRFTVLSESGPLIVHNCELASGYGGGVGAFLNIANSYRLNLVELGREAPRSITPEYLKRGRDEYAWALKSGRTEDLPEAIYVACAALKHAWRDANPEIVGLWAELEASFKAAIRQPGQTFKAAGGKIAMKAAAEWLAMQLPSGRKIMFAKPRIERIKTKREDGSEWVQERITALKSPGWRREPIYGGLLANAITQGGCRDILVDAMLRLDALDYPIVMHIHDEILSDVPDDSPLTHETMIEEMVKPNVNYSGLPLAAAGFTTKRYRKG